MKRKLFCIWMCIALIVTLIPSMAFAEESAANIGERTNMELLDAILQERPWVLETLLDGDLSNNPYALVQPAAENKPQLLIDKVLSNYNDNTAFRAVVNAMEIYSNSGQYISDFTHETLESAMTWYNVSTEDEARELLNELIVSVDELKFESILNEIIKADFTASWGESIIEADSNLENLRQKAKAVKRAEKYQKELKKIVKFVEESEKPSYIDLSSTKKINRDVDEATYAGLLLNAYQEDLEKYIKSVPNICSGDGGKVLNEKIIAIYSLSDIGIEESTIVKGSTPIEIEDTFKRIMCEDTFDALKTSGEILKIGSYAMNYALMLESLTNQTQNLVSTLDYIANETEITDLRTVLNRYSSLVQEEGNKKIMGYEAIVSYIRNKTVVTDLATKKLKETLKDSLGEYYVFYKNGSGMIYASSLATALAKAGLVVDVAVWLGNKIVGIQDTSKKIFLCTYVDNLAEEISTICYKDLNEYRNSPTEESAERILNEIELIKRVRLYGESLAYESVEHQINSWLGKLLSKGCEQAQWEKWHQAANDMLIGCSSVPFNGCVLKLAENETLTIDYCDLENGNWTLRGSISGGNRRCSFAEADLRVMGGIELNGASLTILCNLGDATEMDAFRKLFIPSISTKGDSKIFINNGEANLGEVTNEGNLTVKLGSDTAQISVHGETINKNNLKIVCETERKSGVSTYDLENTSLIQIDNAALQIKGNVDNNGNIQGKAMLCGNGKRAYDSSLLTYAPKQIISGKGTFSDLYIDSTAELGVDVIGEQTITEVFSNPSTTIHNAKRLTVTGNCAIDGGYCYSDLSFRDYATSQATVLEGTGHLYGDVAFGGSTIFLDGLHVTTDCNLLNLSAFTRVAGDMLYAGGTIEGERFLHLCGDVNITTQTPSLKYLCLEGSTPQTIQSTKTLQLEELRNRNTSKKGLLINSPISISDLIYTESGARYRQGKSMTLTANARAEGDVIQGSISAENWTCSNPVNVSGTIFVNGTNQMEESGSLHTNNFVQKGGSLELAEGAQIIAANDAAIDGSFSGGSLEVKGDVSAGALINVNQLILNGKTPQTFNNTATTIAKSLLIDNNAKGGVTINSIINVTDQFKNNCKKLIKGKNIQVGALSDLEMEELAKGDMTVTGSWNISVGKTYTIPGTLYLNKGALVTLQEGATLNIHENINSNSADIIVKQGAALNVKEYTEWTGGSIILEEGAVLNLGSDAKLSGVTIEGKGLLIICGDLHNTNCTWKFPNLKIAGKVPQSISGADIRAANLTLENTSKSGITLQTKLQYQGEKRSNEGKINGSEQISALS